MKDRLQIYVIYFLIWVKMKKIALILFTFSGICTGFAQKPSLPVVVDSLKQQASLIDQPRKNDSAAVKEKPTIRLYPNPAKNKVEIEIKGFDRGYVEVQLTDKNGNLVRNDKRFVFSGNEIIILMFSEKPGLYFLLLKQGKNNVRSKLIIQ